MMDIPGEVPPISHLYIGITPGEIQTKKRPKTRVQKTLNTTPMKLLNGITRRKPREYPSTCLIDRLPPEILVYIFQLCLPTSSTIREILFSSNGSTWNGKRQSWISAREAPLNVSHVCAAWRNIAIESQALWKMICFQGSIRRNGVDSEFDAISTFLKRSSTSPINIFIRLRAPLDLTLLESDRAVDPFRCIDLLMAEKARWRSVNLSFDRSALLEPFMRVLENEVLPVEELFVDCTIFRNGPQHFAPRLYNLKTLHFKSRDNHSFVSWTTSHCPPLKELSLFFSVPLNDFFSWLDNCPTLESIKLKNIFLPQTINIDRDSLKVRHMPHLKELSLGIGIALLEADMAKRAIDLILHSVQAPSLKSLSLSFNSRPDAFCDLESIVTSLRASQSSSLKSLRLRGFGCNKHTNGAQILCHLMNLTPTLETLLIDEASERSMFSHLSTLPSLHMYWPVLRTIHFATKRPETPPIHDWLGFVKQFMRNREDKSTLRQVVIHAPEHSRSKVEHALSEEPYKSWRTLSVGLDIKFSEYSEEKIDNL